MIQHKRLDNQLMSAKVRGKHKLDISTGEASQLISEFNKAVEEKENLKQQIEDLKKQLSEASTTSQTETKAETKQETTSGSTIQHLDGGRW